MNTMDALDFNATRSFNETTTISGVDIPDLSTDSADITNQLIKEAADLLGTPDRNCSETEDLLNIPWFWSGLSFHLVLSPAAFCFNLLFICLLIRKSLLQKNVRIFLGNISFWCAVGAACLLAKSLYALVSALSEPCELVVSLTICKFQETGLVLAEFMITGFIICLGLERAIATAQINASWHKDRAACGQVLTLVIWTLSIGALVLVLFSTGNASLPFCNSVFSYDPLGAQIVTLSLLGLEAFGILFFGLIWFVNWRVGKNPFERSSYSLSWQVNRQRTLQITDMLLPVVGVQGVFCLPAFLVSFLQTHFIHSFSLQVHLVISEFLVHDLLLCFMTLHPLVALWASEALRRELRDCSLCFRLCIPSDNPQDLDSDANFIWVKAKKRDSGEVGEERLLTIEPRLTVEDPRAVDEEMIDLRVKFDHRKNRSPGDLHSTSNEGAPLVREESDFAMVDEF